MAQLVLDDGTKIKTRNIDTSLKRSENPRGNSIRDLMTDRNGNPPTVEQMQDMQNRLMNRDPNFSNLPKEKKEKIMFEELQNWFFKDMPSIEQMKEEVKKHPLTYEVKSLEKQDTVGYKNQHINLLSEDVTLTVVSDGKKINFNNKELLEQYRNAVNNQEIAKDSISDVQARGVASHSSRKFDD